jgi:hypothetical protein
MDSMVSLRDLKAPTRASEKLAVLGGGSVFELSFGLAVVALPKASLIAMSLHRTMLGLGSASRVRATMYAMVVLSGFVAHHHMNWTNFWQCSTEAIFLFSQRISDPAMCSAQASPNSANELCAFLAMQGTKKGGTGIKQRASNDMGCLFDGDAFLKALAVVDDESFEKGGTKEFAGFVLLSSTGDTGEAVSWVEANYDRGLLESGQGHECRFWRLTYAS